ncbi:MAG TPA: sulfate adenylyltransferase subunit CysN [Aliarcobacter cryaerophilus]|nr:sulfate adenylyltransferase subunit CysN [Aliarcobacter cryaerophilus]
MEKIDDIKAYLKEHENKQLLRFITCGNVDDGKSTLIGRLLHDSKGIFEDQLENIKKDSKKNNSTDNEFDLSLLVDGLQSEREQGITIDVAYRYFTTPKRKFIIADTPGHEQYTRNMATGASTANLAIILIDARYGVQTQTKRHSFINKLLGIKHIVVAVNKMDLMDFREDVFNKIKEDYLKFAKELGLSSNITLIPLSALNGDNVVERSSKSPWYKGETLIEHLENVEIHNDRDLTHFRFPVQYVNRANLDFRGFCGTVASGVIKVGDEITVLPSKKSSKVKEIVTYDGNLPYAYAQQAITLTLEDEIDISRGDVIVKSDEQADEANNFDVDIVWLSEDPLIKGKQYFIKRATTTTVGTISQFYYKTDVNTLERSATNTLNLNEIARAKLDLEQIIAYDTYDKIKTMGSFIIIDRVTNNTVGAGMIRSKSSDQSKKDSSYSAFEIEFNALVRKHFPHWECKEIF